MMKQINIHTPRTSLCFFTMLSLLLLYSCVKDYSISLPNGKNATEETQNFKIRFTTRSASTEQLATFQNRGFGEGVSTPVEDNVEKLLILVFAAPNGGNETIEQIFEISKSNTAALTDDEKINKLFYPITPGVFNNGETSYEAIINGVSIGNHRFVILANMVSGIIPGASKVLTGRLSSDPRSRLDETPITKGMAYNVFKEIKIPYYREDRGIEGGFVRGLGFVMVGTNAINNTTGIPYTDMKAYHTDFMSGNTPVDIVFNVRENPTNNKLNIVFHRIVTRMTVDWSDFYNHSYSNYPATYRNMYVSKVAMAVSPGVAALYFEHRGYNMGNTSGGTGKWPTAYIVNYPFILTDRFKYGDIYWYNYDGTKDPYWPGLPAGSTITGGWPLMADAVRGNEVLEESAYKPQYGTYGGFTGWSGCGFPGTSPIVVYDDFKPHYTHKIAYEERNDISKRKAYFYIYPNENYGATFVDIEVSYEQNTSIGNREAMFYKIPILRDGQASVTDYQLRKWLETVEDSKKFGLYNNAQYDVKFTFMPTTGLGSANPYGATYINGGISVGSLFNTGGGSIIN